MIVVSNKLVAENIKLTQFSRSRKVLRNSRRRYIMTLTGVTERIKKIYIISKPERNRNNRIRCTNHAQKPQNSTSVLGNERRPGPAAPAAASGRRRPRPDKRARQFSLSNVR